MVERHPTPDEIDRFVSGRMTPDELAWLDRHLDACDACRQALSSRVPPAAVSRMSATHATGSHLDFAELEAIVKGGLASGGPEARAHLASCELCALELADLQAFEATRTAAAVAAPAARSVAGIWSRLAALVSGSSRARLGWIGAAVAALLVVTLWPRLGFQSTRGVDSAASVAQASRALESLANDSLTADRRARLERILRGEAPPPPTPRTSAELSNEERRLWTWATEALAQQPLLLGALAQDLGLIAEANAAYERALAEPQDRAAARLMLGHLPAPAAPTVR